MLVIMLVNMLVMAGGELLDGHMGDREGTCHRPRGRNPDPFASVGRDVGDHRVGAGAQSPKTEVGNLTNSWKCHKKSVNLVDIKSLRGGAEEDGSGVPEKTNGPNDKDDRDQKARRRVDPSGAAEADDDGGNEGGDRAEGVAEKVEPGAAEVQGVAVVVVAVGVTIMGMIVVAEVMGVVAEVMGVVAMAVMILTHGAMQQPRARSVHDEGRGGDDEHDRLLWGDVPLDRLDGLMDDFRGRQQQEYAVHERG